MSEKASKSLCERASEWIAVDYTRLVFAGATRGFQETNNNFFQKSSLLHTIVQQSKAKDGVEIYTFT